MKSNIFGTRMLWFSFFSIIIRESCYRAFVFSVQWAFHIIFVSRSTQKCIPSHTVTPNEDACFVYYAVRGLIFLRNE